MANILLTGPPGCGKTTVLRRLVGLLPAGTVAGFLTEEIREGRARTGFLARVI
ncbi:MAG: ATP-binding protein, partial [Firmicutes bacterium]|nr:ATP-binding protein [Bacillota bacterium]